MEQRKSFSKLRKNLHGFKLPKIEIPNLLSMQKNSYAKFLQKDIHPQKRDEDVGLEKVFRHHFPIEDPRGQYRLEYINYSLLTEKYDADECNDRNLTYQAPLKVKFRLTVFEKTAQDEPKRVKNVIEQEMFLGEIPVITDKGTFIINGEEKVIINQLHRSPGIVFTGKTHGSGKRLFTAKVIPVHGSWFQFKTDTKDIIYALIDRKHKIPVTTLFRCLGISDNDTIRSIFYKTEEIDIFVPPVESEADSSDQSKGRKNPLTGNEDRIIFRDIIDEESGEIIAEGGNILTNALVDKLTAAGYKKVTVIHSDCEVSQRIIESTLSKDTSSNQEEALKFIYNLIRPGEEPTKEVAEELINRIYFNKKRYSLGKIGRFKLNRRLGIDIDINTQIMTKEDFVAISKEIISLVKGESSTDDIDHLANRNVSGVGDLVANQFSIGLARIVRIARERMTLSNPTDIRIVKLINTNALMGVVHSFFLTGELSQFMEQANPLAAITHMRRLSALGPGGLKRERAGFEVRDVHYSHYGRICPIETPEGPNIGLLTSPSLYAKLDEYGFLVTPYIKIKEGKLTQEVVYLDSISEEGKKIAQAGIRVDAHGNIKDKSLQCLLSGDFIKVPKEEVDYVDASKQQIVSMSTALIPFLEHDDANRALMGSNMQRQGVPLINPQAAIVATGIEKIIARDSELAVKSPFDAVVKSVTSNKIVLKREEEDGVLSLDNEAEIHFKKFERTNQDTCINQHPEVEIGQKVKKDELISDGPAIKDGELALGRNMRVAFMPWYGYNYEDAIIINEQVARDDELTSIYIDELEVLVRTTREGDEELTSDIPNVPKVALRNLDEDGIVKVGSRIKAGDILVGKITPKSSGIDLSPEEKLMRALFGERAGDFSNSSLKAKPGMEGVVVDVKIFARKDGTEENEEEKKEQLKQLKVVFQNENRKIYDFLKKRLTKSILGEKSNRLMEKKTGRFYLPPNKKITEKNINKISFSKLNLEQQLIQDESKQDKIYSGIIFQVKRLLDDNENEYKKKCDRVKYGDELQSGILQMVKIFIAKKRQIEVGDKMAGRHGNKGVIAKIAPIEDMPFMEDGTTVDIILNPMGVPSRMNIGQILETHLGWAAQALGYKAETPVFDGATIDEITKELEKAGYDGDGKTVLYDGKTGEAFHNRVTVGIIYMLKLNHLVVDKMYGRSTGPYSLVTQQPLGGKAQHGGQRLGEMEVWALEAYGASRLLQEMLTVKSDDVIGRNKTYEAITKGKELPKPGIPESFNVLVSELKSLGLNVELISENIDDIQG